MKKNLPKIVIGSVVLLLLIIGFLFWQKSAVQPSKTTASNVHPTKKVDMKSQPEWVQKLTVTAAKGIHQGERGLDNVKISLEGIPAGMVSSLTYTMSYSYKTAQGDGSGGFFTDTPIPVNGETSYFKTFDFGTCSTHSCVRHDNVTSMEIEFDFTTKDGDSPIWSGTVEVK